MRTFLFVSVGVSIALIAAIIFLAPSMSIMSFGSNSGVGREVRAEGVGRRELVERVSAPGEIEPNVKVDVSAEISARILDLPFREGDVVKSGDVIIRLDAESIRASLESSKARRDAERFRLQSEQSRLAGPLASLANARETLKRQQSLFETGDISRQAFDDARSRTLELQAQVEAAKLAISVIESSLAAADADVDQAREALERTVVISPIDGMVTVLNAEVGELVVVGTMNNAGTIIMTIADLSRMRLDARVAESDVAKIATTQPAEVRINAYPDEVFAGVVERIALQRSLDRDGSGFFKTEVQIDLKGRRIYSGLAANVDIEIARHEGLVVESQAVIDLKVDDLSSELRDHPLVNLSKRTVPVVFTIEDGKAVCRPVRLGPSSLAETIIAEGVDVDAKVIVGPYKALEKLKDGDRVRQDGATFQDSEDSRETETPSDS